MLLQPYNTFTFNVGCAICEKSQPVGTRLACLPDDESYNTSDPWICEACVEADPSITVAATDAEWDADRTPWTATAKTVENFINTSWS